MKMDSAYKLANSDIAVEEFDGEFVVLDLVSGNYYSLEGAAALIWQNLMAGASPAAMANACDVNQPCNPDAVLQFCQTLSDNGLIVPSEAEPGWVMTDAVSGAFQAQTSAPETNMFDDLAELMLSDPIHDVEETEGWPVRKTDT
tara:strand:- start:167177 stop:167608 length:432 start_codon:yes stop_codon:yes gene_type:complete